MAGRSRGVSPSSASCRVVFFSYVVVCCMIGVMMMMMMTPAVEGYPVRAWFESLGEEGEEGRGKKMEDGKPWGAEGMMMMTSTAAPSELGEFAAHLQLQRAKEDEGKVVSFSSDIHVLNEWLGNEKFCAERLAECAQRCGGEQRVMQSACGSDDAENRAFACSCMTADAEGVQDAYESRTIEMTITTDATDAAAALTALDILSHIPSLNSLFFSAIGEESSAAIAEEENENRPCDDNTNDTMDATTSYTYGAWLNAVVVDVVTVTVHDPVQALKMTTYAKPVILCAIHAGVAAIFVAVTVLAIAQWLFDDEDDEDDEDDNDEEDKISDDDDENPQKEGYERAGPLITVVVAESRELTPMIYQEVERPAA